MAGSAASTSAPAGRPRHRARRAVLAELLVAGEAGAIAGVASRDEEGGG